MTEQENSEIGRSIGKAARILSELPDTDASDGDIRAAIRRVATMATINSISKDSLINAIRWMLAKQEPKEPIILKGRWFMYARCPTCKENLDNQRKPLFCGFCGQAVLWK